jgi:hypothetical protein
MVEILQLNLGKRHLANLYLGGEAEKDSFQIALLTEPAMTKGIPTGIYGGKTFYKENVGAVRSAIWISHKLADNLKECILLSDLSNKVPPLLKLHSAKVKTY